MHRDARMRAATEQCELTRLGHVKLSPGPVLEVDDDVDQMDA